MFLDEEICNIGLKITISSLDDDILKLHKTVMDRMSSIMGNGKNIKPSLRKLNIQWNLGLKNARKKNPYAEYVNDDYIKKIIKKIEPDLFRRIWPEDFKE